MSKSKFDGHEGDNLIFTNEGWYLPPIGWTPEQIQDAMNRDNPLYPKNMLKKIDELERRIAALEVENEQLKAGK